MKFFLTSHWRWPARWTPVTSHLNTKAAGNCTSPSRQIAECMPGTCPAAKVALARTGLSYVPAQASGSVSVSASRPSQQVITTTLLIVCDANESEMP